MASKLPYMPLWVDDFDNDPQVQFLTLEAEGLYLRLLRIQWRDGHLPADLNKLAILCRHHSEAFNRTWDFVRHLFTETAPGILQNKRLAAERNAAIEGAEGRRDRAKKGAAARWGNQEQGTSTVIDWAAVTGWWNKLAAKYDMASIRGLSKERKAQWRARVEDNPQFMKAIEDELAKTSKANLMAQWFTFDFIISETKSMRFLEGGYRKTFGDTGGKAFSWDGQTVIIKKDPPYTNAADSIRGMRAKVIGVEHKRGGKISLHVKIIDAPDHIKKGGNASLWIDKDSVELSE